ncbi:MAG TPA: hypothetical protein VL985_01685 [Stellaceae bacterium]|nr:hypothetical protein [Stellaceae bacterium]
MRLFLVAASFALLAQTGCLKAQEFSVEPGWYRWADLSDNPTQYVPPPQMAPFDLGHRCLCANGFVAVKDDAHTFHIVKAPAGYSDTIGEDFIR